MGIFGGALRGIGEHEELVVPFPDWGQTARTATSCRSTLLLSSIASLRRHGYLDAYRRAARAETVEAIESAVSGVWLPIDLAVAHYSACDMLGLSSQTQAELGGGVFKRIQGTTVGTFAKTVVSAGAVSPLTALPRINDMSSRSLNGGGVRVVRLGPKDVRIDTTGWPVANVPYFRGGYRGFLREGALLFAKQVVVTELSVRGLRDCASYRLAWV